MSRPPEGSAGSIGHPRSATAEKGALIYERILTAIRNGVFIRQRQQQETDTI